MSSDWSTAEIGSFAKLRSGYSFKSADWKDQGTPVIKISNVKAGRIVANGCGFVDDTVAACAQDWYTKPGDVLIAMTGYVGEVALVQRGEKYLINQRVGRFEFASDSPVDGAFFFYVLQEPEFRQRIEGVARGSAQPNLSSADAHKLKVPVPPLLVQQEIASTLASLDDRIALLRETNATLEAIAQALFKSWFVDFDPVRAKQQGLAPAGMDEGTAALFPDSFEESALGLVPRGWRVETIEGLCDVITNGGTPSRSNDAFWVGGTMPWFKTGDFADGFLLAPSERITDAALAGSSVKVLPANAILMAIYAAPTVGRLGILTEDATFNQACTGMVAKASVGPWFLLLTLFFGRTWFNSRANGAAQQNISRAIVASYQAAVPSEPLLERFHEIADSVYSHIRANSMQAQTLATLRDTLLPRLISGRLRPPNAEALAATA